MSSLPVPLPHYALALSEPDDVQKLLHTLIHRHCVFSGMHNCAAQMERTVQMLTSEQLAYMGIPEEPSGQFLTQWFTIYSELSHLKSSGSTLQEKLVQTAYKIRSQGEGMQAPPPPRYDQSSSSAIPPRPRQGQKRKAPADEHSPMPLRGQSPSSKLQLQQQQQRRQQMMPNKKKSWEDMLPKMEDGSWDTRKIDNDIIRSIDDYQLRLMVLEQRNRQLLRDAREKDNGPSPNASYM